MVLIPTNSIILFFSLSIYTIYNYPDLLPKTTFEKESCASATLQYYFKSKHYFFSTSSKFHNLNVPSLELLIIQFKVFNKETVLTILVCPVNTYTFYISFILDKFHTVTHPVSLGSIPEPVINNSRSSNTFIHKQISLSCSSVI